MTLLTFAMLLAENGNADLPKYIIIPLAFIIPIGVLVLFSLIKPKSGGH